MWTVMQDINWRESEKRLDSRSFPKRGQGGDCKEKGLWRGLRGVGGNQDTDQKVAYASDIGGINNHDIKLALIRHFATLE